VNRRLPIVRVLSFLAVAVLASGVLASAETTNEEAIANANATFAREAFEGASLGTIDDQVLGLALNAASCAVRTGAAARPKTLTVIDFSRPSTQARPWVIDLTPRMRRITLGGPELAGFVSLGTDDHVKLFFPQNAAEQATLETLVIGAGKDNGPMPAMRDYTPRRYDLDTLELDIDFVLHGDGPAATWAEQARPGQFHA